MLLKSLTVISPLTNNMQFKFANTGLGANILENIPNPAKLAKCLYYWGFSTFPQAG